MTYIASDIPFLTVPPQTNDAEPSGDSDKQDDASSSPSIPNKATSLEVVLTIFSCGFLVMICIMNRLKGIERELDERIQTTFGISESSSLTASAIQQQSTLAGHSEEDGEGGVVVVEEGGNNEAEDDWDMISIRLLPFLVVYVPAAWAQWTVHHPRDQPRVTRPQSSFFGLFRSNGIHDPSVGGTFAANERLGVSRKVSDRWKRLSIHVQSSDELGTEGEATALLSGSSSAYYDTTDLESNAKDQTSMSSGKEDKSDQRSKSPCQSPLLSRCRESGDNSITVPMGADCVICLNEYKERDKVVRLPCRHFYHDTCLSPWVSKSVHCPLCKCNLQKHSDSSIFLPVEE
jgi:hypothetical protein